MGTLEQNRVDMSWTKQNELPKHATKFTFGWVVGARRGHLIVRTSRMIRIRRLAARDYRAVKKIERIIVDEYLGYLKETGEEDAIEPWITPEYFNHYVRAQASYVAEIGRKLVGFILVQATSFVHDVKREIWLEYIAVEPASRRRGIGTMLMSSVIEYANTHDIPLLYPTLNPNNKESIQFLTRHGFEVKDWKEAAKKLRH